MLTTYNKTNCKKKLQWINREGVAIPNRLTGANFSTYKVKRQGKVHNFVEIVKSAHRNTVRRGISALAQQLFLTYFFIFGI